MSQCKGHCVSSGGIPTKVQQGGSVGRTVDNDDKIPNSLTHNVHLFHQNFCIKSGGVLFSRVYGKTATFSCSKSWGSSCA